MNIKAETTKQSRIYLSCFTACLKNPHAFVQAAIKVSPKYIVLHSILLIFLLFFPVFSIMISLEPLVVYERFYGIDTTHGQVIDRSQALFSTNNFTIENKPQIIIYQDLVVFQMQEFGNSAPTEFFGEDVTTLSFAELFNRLALYHQYDTKILLPLLWILYLIVAIMVLLFLVLGCFSLKVNRKFSSTFTFSQSFKLITLSASLPALVGGIFGFFLPAVHIALFQLLHLLFVFRISRRYDQQEKELLLCESLTH